MHARMERYSAHAWYFANATAFVARVWIGPCLRAVAVARRTFEMATAPIVAAPRPEIEHTINPLKSAWRRFGTPVLVVLMALAIALTLTRNWNAWEGGRVAQVTDDALFGAVSRRPGRQS